MSAPVAEGMSHGGEDDVALVVRTLAGDRAAFGTLVQRYEEPVRRVARAVLHDVSDADDAAQDTFLTALMKLDRYDRGGRSGRGCCGSRRTPRSTGAATARCVS